MKFPFKNAPEWFHSVILHNYTDELHAIQKAQKNIPDYNDNKFKQTAVEFFTGKGFTVWLDDENQLWFDVDPDSPRWTYEILRGD